MGIVEPLRDILRAIIEGLDYQFLDVVTALESALGGKLERFVGATTADQLAEEYAFIQAYLEEI